MEQSHEMHANDDELYWLQLHRLPLHHTYSYYGESEECVTCVVKQKQKNWIQLMCSQCRAVSAERLLIHIDTNWNKQTLRAVGCGHVATISMANNHHAIIEIVRDYHKVCQLNATNIKSVVSWPSGGRRYRRSECFFSEFWPVTTQYFVHGHIIQVAHIFGSTIDRA